MQTAKKKAVDYSALLDKKPTYTPYVPPADDVVDPDATVVDSEGMDMAQMMGFSGFGKQKSAAMQVSPQPHILSPLHPVISPLRTQGLRFVVESDG